MNVLENFWNSVKKEEAALLSTAAGGRVTMRTVSPVYYQDAILIFTSPSSTKYKQLQENPNCCIAVGGCFLEAKAEFLGQTMLESNDALRAIYTEKFRDAFNDQVPFGGNESDFVLFRPIRLTGWGFENGMPTGPVEHIF